MGALIRKTSVIEDLSKEAEPPLVLMTRPPGDPMEREVIGGQLWTGVLMRFEGTLSEQDKELWHNPPVDLEKSPQHLRIMHMFDDFLLRQFSEWGWRLLMSTGALQRLSEWEKHNPELLKRFGDGLELKSRVLRGEKSAPLAEDIEKFADRTIPELERLLRMQRDHFGPSTGGLVSKRRGLDEGANPSRPNEFPSLRGNLAQLCGWVETLPA